MNIYRNRSSNGIYCTPDGDGNINGFDFLGFDENITDENKKFVIGFEKKTRLAVFDSAIMKAEETRKANEEIQAQMDIVKKLCVDAMAIDDQKELAKQREIYNDLKGKLK